MTDIENNNNNIELIMIEELGCCEQTYETITNMMDELGYREPPYETITNMTRQFSKELLIDNQVLDDVNIFDVIEINTCSTPSGFFYFIYQLFDKFMNR